MIVLDASVALGIVRQTDEGRAMLARIRPDQAIASTTLIRAELASALWQHVRAGSYSQADAQILLRRALALITEMHDTGENCIEALNEAIRLKHSPYDIVLSDPCVQARRHALHA